ncbi:hypothetical protein [Amycolatopsis sp. lyj-109]|uniref:hypothetical protein n=1 Tax=Amycolatopsis sp. lyj-109 TaxID=2789287 RepID=UPI00397820B8
MDRRSLLKIGAGAAVTVAGSVLLSPSAAAAATSDLPPVPGMLGDRRANELWYQLDEISLYNPTQETADAIGAFFGYIGGEQASYTKWFEFVQEPGYPQNYAEYLKPVEQPLRTLSKLQLDNFDRYYCNDHAGLIGAFAAFGQGVLFDPRRADDEAEVHAMDGDPTHGYHRWHGILRGNMVLGIDRARWARLNPVLGFAWALQSAAKPDHRSPNPGPAPAQVREFARYWLPRDTATLDVDFQTWPYPPEIG